MSSFGPKQTVVTSAAAVGFISQNEATTSNGTHFPSVSTIASTSFVNVQQAQTANDQQQHLMQMQSPGGPQMNQTQQPMPFLPPGLPNGALQMLQNQGAVPFTISTNLPMNSHSGGMAVNQSLSAPNSAGLRLSPKPPTATTTIKIVNVPPGGSSSTSYVSTINFIPNTTNMTFSDGANNLNSSPMILRQQSPQIFDGSQQAQQHQMPPQRFPFPSNFSLLGQQAISQAQQLQLHQQQQQQQLNTMQLIQQPIQQPVMF